MNNVPFPHQYKYLPPTNRTLIFQSIISVLHVQTNDLNVLIYRVFLCDVKKRHQFHDQHKQREKTNERVVKMMIDVVCL